MTITDTPTTLVEQVRELRDMIHATREAILEAIRWQTQADAYPDEVDDDLHSRLVQALLSAATTVEEAWSMADRLHMAALDGKLTLAEVERILAYHPR